MGHSMRGFTTQTTTLSLNRGASITTFLTIGRTARLTILLAVISWSACLSAAKATAVVPPDFATMVQRAEVIFRGQVTAVQSDWIGEGTQRRIETHVTFNVIKVLKGTAATPYVLRMLGGTVAGQTMEVTGVPKFQVGDRTLLFVEHNGTQFFPVVGIMHGYFKVQDDAKTGQETLLKFDGSPLQGTTDIDKAHERALATSGAVETETSPSGTAMKVSDFENAIKGRMSSSH